MTFGDLLFALMDSGWFGYLSVVAILGMLFSAVIGFVWGCIRLPSYMRQTKNALTEIAECLKAQNIGKGGDAP